jgi:hypothetical protein
LLAPTLRNRLPACPILWQLEENMVRSFLFVAWGSAWRADNYKRNCRAPGPTTILGFSIIGNGGLADAVSQMHSSRAKYFLHLGSWMVSTVCKPPTVDALGGLQHRRSQGSRLTEVTHCELANHQGGTDTRIC